MRPYAIFPNAFLQRDRLAVMFSGCKFGQVAGRIDRTRVHSAVFTDVGTPFRSPAAINAPVISSFRSFSHRDVLKHAGSVPSGP